MLGDVLNAKQCTYVGGNKQDKPWKKEKSSKEIPGSARQGSESVAQRRDGARDICAEH